MLALHGGPRPQWCGACPPDDSGRTRAHLRSALGLEVANRIDEIVTFRPLDADDVNMMSSPATKSSTSLSFQMKLSRSRSVARTWGSSTQ